MTDEKPDGDAAPYTAADAGVGERDGIVRWMRTAYPMNRHAQEWANAIEKRHDVEWAKTATASAGRDDCPHGARPGVCPVSGCANHQVEAARNDTPVTERCTTPGATETKGRP